MIFVVECDDFAVDDGVVGQFCDGFDHLRKAAGEVLLIARPELRPDLRAMARKPSSFSS
jgi:hypothetical protein